MALTPNDVLNKQFQTTKFRDGYDQDEVDDFLDEVLAEFQRLTTENEALRAQLAAAPAATTASEASAAPVAAVPAAGLADTAETESLRTQLQAAQAQLADLQGQLAAAQTQASDAQAAAEQARQQAQQAGLDGMGSAEYLQLARRVHEEHVREGVAKRDQLIADGTSQSQSLVAEAQSKADSLVADAQTQAGALVSEAQSKAELLVAEAQTTSAALTAQAQQQYDAQVKELAAQVSGLEQSKTVLEQNVSELQEFERNYRASLKSTLEAHLGELAGVATATVPAVAAAATGATPLPVAEGAPAEEAPAEDETESTATATASAETTGAPEATETTAPPAPSFSAWTAAQQAPVEPPVDAQNITMPLDEPAPAPSADQIFTYEQTGFAAPATPAESQPQSWTIPDFGSQRLDTAEQGLPDFGQATGEQPQAPGFGGN